MGLHGGEGNEASLIPVRNRGGMSGDGNWMLRLKEIQGCGRLKLTIPTSILLDFLVSSFLPVAALRHGVANAAEGR